MARRDSRQSAPSVSQSEQQTIPSDPQLPRDRMTSPQQRNDQGAEAVTVPHHAEALLSKKRKRSTKKTPALPAVAPAPGAPRTASMPSPSRVLIIDNGGDTVKYGWNTDPRPQLMDNVTARLAQQWTVLVGDQLKTIQNPNQLLGVTRSTERGIITNLGNQVQVWKRILDLLGVAVPLHTDTAHAFGWKRQQLQSKSVIPPASCAVLIALPPYCPRTLLESIAQVWMEDFEFSRVGFCVSTFSARREHPRYTTSLTVDLGWSATQIVPSFGDKVLQAGIRRVQLGGRHLINIWKYYASYRQWNLMDQDWVLRDVLRKAGFVSSHFQDDIQLARTEARGKRPFDRDYLLPDYQETFTGSIRLPPSLLVLLEPQNDVSMGESDDNDSSVNQMDLVDCEEDIEHNFEDIRDERRAGSFHQGDDDTSDDEEEEETLEQARARLLRQRAAEERLRQELAMERQILSLSVERFCVPESLFRPSDAFLPTEIAGLSDAIKQSIEACEGVYQPALYQSIHLVGGLSQLEGLQQRLQKELQSLSSSVYAVSVTSLESSELAIEQAWLGACKLSRSPYLLWSFSRDSWETHGNRRAWKHLQLT